VAKDLAPKSESKDKQPAAERVVNDELTLSRNVELAKDTKEEQPIANYLVFRALSRVRILGKVFRVYSG
jgi:hypothetical protein